MSLHLQQLAEARQSMEDQLAVRAGSDLHVVGVIHTLTKLKLDAIRAQGKSDLCRILADHEHRNGIAARVSRSVLFSLANGNVYPNEESEDVKNDTLVPLIREGIEDELRHMLLRGDTYIPVGGSNAEKLFYAMHGPIKWDSHDISTAVIAADDGSELPGSAPSSRRSRIVDSVARSVQALETLGEIDAPMRAIFERVRTATFGAINRANMHKVFPKIRDSYNSALLQSSTIELLRDNKHEDMEKFAKRMNRGVFVFGFDEEVNGHPSVQDQMRSALSKEYQPDEPSYQCRYLEDDKGNILAWFTYWQTPKEPGDTHRKMINDYLDHGVTGGRMNYTTHPHRRDFRGIEDTTLMIDTLRGGVPYAAARLVAKTSSDICEENPNIDLLLGYRVHSIMINPPFRRFREPIRNTENLNSAQFFFDRSCMTFARDFNRKGPMSKRILSDSSEKFLNPEWAAFNCEFPEFFKRSWKLWRNIQCQYGDVSTDGYKNVSEKFTM